MADTSTTTAPLDAAFVDDFAHRWAAAWDARDGDALGRLCTEDVEFFDPAIGTVRGRAAVADWVRACARMFPDYRFEEPELPYIARDREKVIFPWRMTGTNTGPIDPPGFAPTGKAVVLDGVDHWWFRDGLVERYRADYDSNGLLRQVGLMPPQGSRAEKAMAAMHRLGAQVRRRPSAV